MTVALRNYGALALRTGDQKFRPTAKTPQTKADAAAAFIEWRTNKKIIEESRVEANDGVLDVCEFIEHKEHKRGLFGDEK
jgi:hypothetical protein